MLDAALGEFRFDAQHFFTVYRLGREVFGSPAQVVVVFQSARVEGAQVDEVGQALLLVQVIDEAVGAGGVAQGYQVLEEGDLQLALGGQGFTVPAIVSLLFDK